MTALRLFAAWLRPLAGLFALAGVLALSACGGGSGAPNNPFAPPPATLAPLTVLPATLTVYAQVATTVTISGGVAPYRAFSNNTAVLPVVQNLPGTTITLLANGVASSTAVDITIQDSAGATVTASVTVLPGPPTPPSLITVLPVDPDVYSTIASSLSITGGVPPYRAFSNNSTVLPVSSVVAGNSLLLLASNVATDTRVVITIQDSVAQVTSVTATVHPKPNLAPALSVLPTSVVTSKGVPVTIAIIGGAPPFKAFSSDSVLLPVNQTVTGSSLVLIAAGAPAVATNVTVTIQDSAGQTAIVAVTVTPDSSAPPPALTVLPSTLTIFAGTPTTLTVAGGTPPYAAFSSNPTVLPVTQKVAGGVIPLYASTLAVATPVTITIQDSNNKSTAAAVTVQPTTLLNTLTVKPNLTDCGAAAICSGQSGTATVTLQLPGGGPAAGRQVRFDVVAGPYGIVNPAASPATQTVLSLAVNSDANGNAQVIVRANVDAPTQPAQIRVTDIASGQQLTSDFLIQQVTDGSKILTVVAPEAIITGPYIGVCSEGVKVDYYIYGGTPPYRITQSFPGGVILVNPTVNASGGFFQVITTGACVKPETFSIVDATGRQVTATLVNEPGTVAAPGPTPPTTMTVTPADISGLVCTGATFTFVVTGGTPGYNVTASPQIGSSPTVTPTFVQSSGGTVRVSNFSQSILLTFADSAPGAQQTVSRKITCPGSATPPDALSTTPSFISYVGTTCVGKTSTFTINGGTQPYTVAFTNGTPSGASITPTSVLALGGSFAVSGLKQSGSVDIVKNFITVTDVTGQQVFPHVDCGP